MITRRTFVAGTALAPALLIAPRLWADATNALQSSKLVYLTPLKSDGEESRCKAEIWFAFHDGDVYVVTQADAWRAEAVRQGLNQARIWVGDFGIWTDADDAFRAAPQLETTASLETDAEAQTQVLQNMGEKYADDGWSRWGPRFRTGLDDGSRVMIRYTPAS